MTNSFLRSFLFASLLAACSSPAKREAPAESSSTDTAAAPAGDPKAEALQIFQQRCTPCHGPTGSGDGPASASLNPKPRNFTNKEWQGTVPDEYIEKIIVYGGQAVGKSAAMPPNPDLGDKPAVVSALKDKVRGFGR